MKKLFLLLLIMVLLATIVCADESFYPTTIGELNAEARLTGNGNVSGLKQGEEVKGSKL